jgi:hypothetical protein
VVCNRRWNTNRMLPYAGGWHDEFRSHADLFTPIVSHFSLDFRVLQLNLLEFRLEIFYTSSLIWKLISPFHRFS